jgi:hypothetical protein
MLPRFNICFYGFRRCFLIATLEEEKEMFASSTGYTAIECFRGSTYVFMASRCFLIVTLEEESATAAESVPMPALRQPVPTPVLLHPPGLP